MSCLKKFKITLFYVLLDDTKSVPYYDVACLSNQTNLIFEVPLHKSAQFQ